jgi:hypothetical protein
MAPQGLQPPVALLLLLFFGKFIMRVEKSESMSAMLSRG